jgi:hypothetical protein
MQRYTKERAYSFKWFDIIIGTRNDEHTLKYRRKDARCNRGVQKKNWSLRLEMLKFQAVQELSESGSRAEAFWHLEGLVSNYILFGTLEPFLSGRYEVQTLKYHINTRSHLAHSMCLQINFSRNSWL